jgi:opacity protein-like surface antigen
VIGLVTLAIVSLALAAPPAQAEDTDQFRFYWAMRLGLSVLTDGRATSSVDADTRQQLTGMSLGVNLGRYLSLEVAGDVYETELRSGGRKLGEYGMLSLIPQARLRFPVLDGRLTPYLVGGVGIAHNEFNDRKPLAVGTRIRASDTTVVGAFGAGIEYFIANNVAVGVEARYLVSRDQEIEIGGRRESASLDAILAAASLRVLFPETPAAARAAPVEPAPSYGLYVGFRVGAAVAAPQSIGSGFSVEHENAVVFGGASQLYGAALGADLGRHVSLEMTFSGWEGNIRLRGVGTVEEYAVYSFMPAVRLRLPLLGGRLVPYVLGGAGVGWHETNDGKPLGAALDVTGKDWGFVGAVGVGVDYFVARNVALGVESAYYLSRGHRLALAGRGHDVDLSWIATTFGLRLYFAGAGRP